MDEIGELAQLGALLVTEGAAAPMIITTHDATGHELQPGPDFTPEDRLAADNVFTTQRNDSAPSIPATLLVVGASIATLKSIAIDEQKSHEHEESKLVDEEAEKEKTRKKTAK